MDANALLVSAFAAYRAGRFAEARDSAEAIWSLFPNARAAGLLALIELDAGRFDEAMAWNDRAHAADPGEARYVLQGARLAGLKGDHSGAFDRLATLLRAAPQAGTAWLEFAAAAKASGRSAEAIAICASAFDTDPTLAVALQALLNLTPDTVTAGASHSSAPLAQRRSISIVTCSHDDARYAAAAASYARALAGRRQEIVRIADAKSLAEGYSRGVARATGEIVVFTHDDVEILAGDFGDRLERRLDECDVLGIAGATRATGPAWPFAGWPYLHGSVIYPDGEGYRVTAYSRTVPIAHGIRVMDGVFLAMSREIALRIGWDVEACAGFHGYDVDFTLRAAQAGLRLAVASDLGVVHRSYGSFDERWEASARKLVARHPELDGERGAETGFVARSVPDAAHAMALVDNWARTGRAS
jgi:tetratricopeptide (TPR) repeat protein